MTQHIVQRYSAEKLATLAKQLHAEAERIDAMAQERMLDERVPLPTVEELFRLHEGYGG
jgi:hypothetical protein